MKAAYLIPSMREIATVPWNGFNVVSTFSGCGGSCLGYRMAGYRVLWANEFIAEAQATYKANHPNSILDCRDIRQIKGRDILEATKLEKGDLDLFDGSPPCASFSSAGKRDAHWGKVKSYSDTQQRVDDLFFEYSRLLGELQPKVFVAENVAGLTRGRALGAFQEIIRELRSKGYRVECRTLDAQWLGVPQQRRRVIFIGVRNDLGFAPTFPIPLRHRYTVGDALPWLKTGHPSPFEVEPETDIRRYEIGKQWHRTKQGTSNQRYFSLKRASITEPSFCVTQTGGVGSAASVTHPTEPRKFSIAELKRICAFPDDFILTGSYAQRYERLGRAVPPTMMKHIAETIAEEILCQIKPIM